MRNILLLMPLLLAACSNLSPAMPEDDESALALKIENEIAQAKMDKDFRLYAFSGRRVTIPGLSREEADRAKTRCGTKFMPDSGDVIRTEQQRLERRAKFDFASGYNRQMYRLCLGQ